MIAILAYIIGIPMLLANLALQMCVVTSIREALNKIHGRFYCFFSFSDSVRYHFFWYKSLALQKHLVFGGIWNTGDS